MTEPQENSVASELPQRLVGIQFRRAAAIVHDYIAADFDVPTGTRVVVDTEHGESLAWTVGEISEREPHQLELEGPLRRILRVATPADLSKETDLRGQEHDALRHCALRARQLDLDMKLVAAEWQHSGGRVVFYFSSEQRVDFRALVRELAQKYRSRVEMRQVGPRDEAKIIGAMGPCGRETCCSSWLRAFAPVTIKMAKDQGLALNPQKTMGVCGRLLCCLAYEQDTYTALRRALPRVGKQVGTPKGPGRIVDVFALRGSVRVALDSGGRWEEFLATELGPVEASRVPAAKASGAAVESSGAAVKPRDAAVKPRDAAVKPRDAAVKPRDAAVKPRDAAVKPRDAAVKPRDAAVKPRDAAVKPRDAAVKPRDAAVKPRDAAVKPRDAAVKPRDAAVKPRDAAVKPSGAASTPSGPASTPSEKTESRHKRRRRRGRSGGEGGDAEK